MEDNCVEILLVEDNPDDIEMLLYAFEKYQILESYKTYVAKDGVEALQYLFGSEGEENGTLAHHPKLILLDLRLPKLHGLEVLKKVKSHEVAKKIPVVVLTSSDKKADWVDAHSLGADSYLRKSGEINQFIEAAGWAILGVINKP